MELDLESLFGLLCTAVLMAETPQLPPPLAFGLKYKGATGQPRQTTSLCGPLVADLTKQLCAAPLIPMLETVYRVTLHKTLV
jgi:hypothetical protein